MLDQEVDEGTHLGREVAAWRIDSIDLGVGCPIAVQHLGQAAGLQVLADQLSGHKGDAVAARQQFQDRLNRVDLDVALHLDGFGAFGVVELPDVPNYAIKKD